SPHAIMFNNYTHFVEVYMCRVVHNPVATSVLLLLSGSLVHGAHLQLVVRSQQYELLFAEDYVLDLISNAINLVFLLRFLLQCRFPVAIEAVLFLAQNYGCYLLLTDHERSFLYGSGVLTVLKACLVGQIMFPYLIMVMNLVEWCSVGYKDEPYPFLFECNNNYLPIFVSHSFLYINTGFPLLADTAVLRNALLVYTLSEFSIKFYCIYKFILFEVGTI
ncbi:uncharacterized protein CANTADRAFT_28669, partial [Suhomyces tanzawaensis NRRL Y-17324]